MIYWLGWLAFKLIFTTLYRRQTSGLNNLPQAGPYILAANHLSYADPPLVGTCIRKQIYFIAKKQLFKIPILGWLIKHTNAFPVDRDAVDISALKSALKILQNGNILLIFPEGTRYKPGKTRKLKNGAAMLAIATNLPVIPVAVINSDNLFKFRRLKVKFGTPLKFDSKENYDTITERIMSEIESMKDDTDRCSI
ncbi:MAG: lysophospholipid acyltransferase family protein [Elusimicrobiota bacterium]